MSEIEQRKCTQCEENKSFSCFSKKHTGKYGLSSRCKQCCLINERLERGHGITDINLLTDKQKKVRKRRVELWKVQSRKNPEKTLLLAAKSRAKAKNLEFNITENDICINKTCPVLGIAIEKSDKTNNYNSISLDRLDSTKGYTKDNINIISLRANKIKSDATFEEFEAIYKWWKSELKKRKKKPCPNTMSK
jgi:hypothetical protein